MIVLAPAPIAHAQPAARYGQVSVHDPVADRMVVWGGRNDTSLLYDAQTVSLGPGPTACAALATTGTPPFKSFRCSAIYDPDGDRVIVFGGGDLSAQPTADLYELKFNRASNNATWRQLLPDGNAFLKPRWGHTAIHDPVNHRMIVFGGTQGNGVGLNDAWQLSLTGALAWTQISAANPPSARYGHTAVYDPVHARMLVLGGHGALALFPIHALSMTTLTWSQHNGGPATPEGRAYHTAVYDPAFARVIVYGGDIQNRLCDDPQYDVSALYVFANGTTFGWSNWNMALEDRYLHTAILDPGSPNRMVAFGGREVFITPTSCGAQTNGEIWQLPLTWYPPNDATVSQIVCGAAAGIGLGDERQSLEVAPDDQLGVTFAQSFPNPFSEVTIVRFALAHGAEVRAEIFDVAGRRMRILANGRLEAGPHDLSWDGRDERGQRAATGLYLCRIQAGESRREFRLIRQP